MTDSKQSATRHVSKLAEITWPIVRGQGADVVGEGIQPHIDGVTLVSWEGNAPAQVGAAYGEVPQTGGNEISNFVESGLRAHELGMLVVEFEQRLLVFG